MRCAVFGTIWTPPIVWLIERRGQTHALSCAFLANREGAYNDGQDETGELRAATVSH